MQRALLQFFKAENYFEVRRALEEAGRQDLIGSGCDCLIPDRPPREALDRRRREALREVREAVSGDHIRGGPGRPLPEGPGAAGAPAPGPLPGRRTRRPRRSIGYRPERRGSGGDSASGKP
jgi:hypothetical protein